MDISDISLKYVNVDVNRMKGSLDYDDVKLKDIP